MVITKCKIQGRNATIFTDGDIVVDNSDTSNHFDNYNSGVSCYNSCIYVYPNGYTEFYIYALASTTFRVRYDDTSQDYTTQALNNLSGTLYGPPRYGGSKDGCYITWGAHSTVVSSLSDANVPVFYDWNEAKAYISVPYVPPVVPITSNGGGATHIAKVTGQLSSLSNNLSNILMVSGGGGGGLIIGEDIYAGKDAGGISGNGNNSANQTTGYAFGQGESGAGYSGGGGGLYGGYKGGTS